MQSLSVLADFLGAYTALSPFGRDFLRRQRLRAGDGHSSAVGDLVEDRAGRRSLIRSLKACDRVFLEMITDDLGRRAGRSRAALYARFVPFAWINLEVRYRLLDAYELTVDPADELLTTLLVFIHREWDDLRETRPPKELFRLVTSPSPPEPALLIAWELTRKMQDHYRRKGGLESFSGDWERALDFYERPFRPEEAASYLETKAEIVQRIYFAALLSDVPEDLRKVLRRLSLWLYALDETADLVRDRAQGRVTYMTVAADPVAELRRFHAEFEETVRSTARRDPKLLFSLMKAMTEGVVAAVLSGKDIEGDLFGAPEGPVNRSADPSSPRRAGGA